MDECQGGLEGLVAQVREVGWHLAGREHALVDDRPRGHRADVELLSALDRLAHRAGGELAGHEEASLELDLGVAADRAGHDDLPDGRLPGDGRGAQGAVVGGHLAPAQDLQPQLVEGALEVEANPVMGVRVARQEALADGVVARSREGDAELRALPQEEGVGQLNEDASAIARGLLGAAGAAVVEVRQDVDALADDVVRDDVVEISHEADAARIVLEPGVVESLLRLRVVHRGVLVRDVRPRGQRPGGPASRRIPPRASPGSYVVRGR